LGREQVQWLDQLEREHDNLRAALDWAVQGTEDNGQPTATEALPWQLGLRLATAVWRFWWVRGYVHEGRRWLGTLLPYASVASPERGDALAALAALASYQGDYARARRFKEECLAVRQAIGEPVAIARALNSLGLDAQVRGDYVSAEERCAECVALLRDQQQ